MTKNTITAVILSVGFLILWNKFYYKKNLNQNIPRPIESVNDKKSTPNETLSKSYKKDVKESEKTFVIEGKDARITFTTLGAAIKKYELKNQTKTTELSTTSYINILPDGDGVFFATTHIGDMMLSEGNFIIKKKQNGEEVIFEQIAQQPGKNKTKKYLVRKTYHLSEGEISFLNGLDIEIISQPEPVDKKSIKENITSGDENLLMVFSNGLVDSNSNSGKPNNSDDKENISLNTVKYLPTVGKKVHKIKIGTEIPLSNNDINTLWVASENRYYLTTLIPTTSNDGFRKGDILKVTKPDKNSYPQATISLAINDNTHNKRSFKVYIGGKSLLTLKKTAPHLEKTIDFGFIGGLGKFFLESLIYIEKFTRNYGWAIVILSLIIQIITLPLSLKSLKATADMKRLQPLMREIQEKYKNDPKRMNVEMMNLYRTHKVNPLSGCLPMLLQMPIFWALFTTLRNAYELKGAGWIWWIKDLSMHDPFYILPILMGLGMFGQQFMSGATHDPQNKMMAYIFPIIFTFMFLKFPSGVVLYWLINSILTISIQFFFLEKEVIKEHHKVV